jgi:hypothetical protein
MALALLSLLFVGWRRGRAPRSDGRTLTVSEMNFKNFVKILSP